MTSAPLPPEQTLWGDRSSERSEGNSAEKEKQSSFPTEAGLG